ncbi:MAG: apolipoprotein N-acyltransferase [Candidatus Binatia bacterium]
MKPILLILLSAALHALAFPPWNVVPLAFVAVVPFLIAIRGLSPRRAALAGHLWGSAAIWGVGYWVADALTFYYQQPWWFGLLFCLVGCQILWGLYYALFAAGASFVLPRLSPVWRPAATAALWVACELARARLLTGEPWMLLGYALVPNVRLIQAADLGGVYLLSFVAIFANAALAELLLAAAAARGRLAPRLLAPPLVLLAVAFGYGTLRLGEQFPHDPPLRVAIVQGNGDLGSQWRPELYGAGLELYTRLSRDAARAEPPDLLVWPESAVTFFPAHEPGYRAALADGLRGIGAELILGAPHHEQGADYFNSAFHVHADGTIAGRYDKVHLLPFGEYFPLRFLDFLRRRFERVRTFTPGDDRVLLDTRAGPTAVVICFEAIFPEIVRDRMAAGATLLVNLSNDVWLGRGVGQAQHLAMVVLRAVENRTWVVRATTTGISAFIDPWGRIQAASRMNEEAVLSATVTPQRIPTLYERIGDLFAYACGAAALAVLLWGMLLHHRGHREHRGRTRKINSHGGGAEDAEKRSSSPDASARSLWPL